MTSEEDKLPSISILIPAYNCENYIENALNSVFNQTYEGKIEVIVGYDTKSTDNTLLKIQNVQSRHSIIIDSDNDSSIGAGRNRLLKLATSDYVLFMDSDDMLMDTLVENAMGLFNKVQGLKIVAHKHKCLKESKALSYYQTHHGVENPQYKMLSRGDVMHSWWLSRKCSITVWGYVYDRKYLIDNNVEFPDYSHGEDQIFILKSVLNTDWIGYINAVSYIYVYREDSISHVTKNPEEFWNEHTNYRKDYYDLIADKYPSVYCIAYLNFLTWYIGNCGRILKRDEFIKAMKTKCIKRTPVIFSRSMQHNVNYIVFNYIPKKIYWKIMHVREKILKRD